ncbi:MAG: hypothetical protein ACOXZ5_02960 [Syntrophomonadaceae bacterium]|jgi:hypothetical protein
MSFLLGAFAAIILILYSWYFIKIITGTSRDFETELLKTFTTWIIDNRENSQRDCWIMVAITIFFEVVYFSLVVFIIDNPVMLVFTGGLAGFELIHIFRVGIGLSRFFKGDSKVKHIFNWKIERTSAVLFFTHALLVLIDLAFF